ncbi:protein ABHD18 [Daktulosphaira vitifoliae]|uniref:protein ABHD18 n=1 Tax=Daktulosphaira vitifoliae TaxID=58002 RepID=UPI0021A9CDF2|nr:protein ABHD18 [Daktulosphaira vitifoliae]
MPNQSVYAYKIVPNNLIKCHTNFHLNVTWLIVKSLKKLLLSKYFVDGWGDPDKLKRLFEFRKLIVNRDSCYKLVPPNYPVEIVKKNEDTDSITFEGVFQSPFSFYLPKIVPIESHLAHFQLLLPKKWPSKGIKPVCLHMAGTGDQNYWRRRTILAKPLLKEAGIGSIILENPFYGKRKPINQVRSILCNVSDIFVMGACLILESLVLFHWCEREGFGPLGVTGLSMGGHMSSLAAASWPKPIVVVPCLSGTTASGVFTEGAISCAIDWNLLEQQYKSNKTYENEVANLDVDFDSLKREFYAGKKFVKDMNYSSYNVSSNTQSNSSLENLEKLNNSSQLFSTNQPKERTKLSIFHNLNNIAVSKNIKNEVKKDVKRVENLMKYFYHSSKTEDLNLKALSFMKGIMDECTHLRNFNRPADMDLVIAICAKKDGYVPLESMAKLEDIWPGADVRYVDTGHVAAFLLHRNTFKNAIIEGFSRAQNKYYSE